MAPSPPIFKDHVSTLNVTNIGKALVKNGRAGELSGEANESHPTRGVKDCCALAANGQAAAAPPSSMM